MSVFDKYGGGLAERAVYRRLAGVNLGPRRAPTGQFDESQYDTLVAELSTVGFFNQSK
jgi:N-acetylneuraminate lyase